jgi:GTP-binding protein EngB required for normal cell division
MKPSDFDAKPMILLLGQYSVGKTSFIRYLIGKEFPGARIGPEPTTDRFNAVMWGAEDRIVPGNALAVDPSMPFSSLTKFGTEFLNKFQASMTNSPVLEKVYFVDSPGVLSGEKQKLGRAYDFVKVTEWFAQRADLILLLFDAHKLDISDEFQAAIKALKGQDDKIRVVLNKADKVTSQQLMRVYGAMMWSLGKVVATPEVARVYIGSFWDGPCQNIDLEPFFRAEQSDLLRDLHELPRNAAVRKVNELIKRVRMARVHALIIGHLKGKMPFFGQASKQKQLLENLADEFYEVMKKTRLPQGDFPNLQRFKEVASTYDFGKFPKFNEKMMEVADTALSAGIPDLLRQLADEQDAKAVTDRALRDQLMEAPLEVPESSSGASSGPSAGNPFGGVGVGGKDAYAIWAAQVNKENSDSMFKMLPGGQEGRVSGAGARDTLLESGLQPAVLRHLWDLSDVDKDGFLSAEEFAVCHCAITPPSFAPCFI